jgi:hypothetical protein
MLEAALPVAAEQETRRQECLLREQAEQRLGELEAELKRLRGE